MADHPCLKETADNIFAAYSLLADCYEKNGKLLVCGNGGSAADSDHIVGELMKGFRLKRPLSSRDRMKLSDAFPEEGQYLIDNLQGALPAISLSNHSALVTAYLNDVQPDMIFAQQVYGYGKPGDVLLGLSTSGNSRNVINAIKVATAFGLKTIGMTGESGGEMKGLCDITIRAPSSATYKVQEYHLPVYHAL